MKIIDLNKFKNKEYDLFFLGEKQYKYTPSAEDKIYFLEELKKLNIKKDLQKSWIKVFKKLLSRENININITENDLFSLINYFSWKLL